MPLLLGDFRDRFLDLIRRQHSIMSRSIHTVDEFAASSIEFLPFGDCKNPTEFPRLAVVSLGISYLDRPASRVACVDCWQVDCVNDLFLDLHIVCRVPLIRMGCEDEPPEVSLFPDANSGNSFSFH